jgi:hypothetical protein
LQKIHIKGFSSSTANHYCTVYLTLRLSQRKSNKMKVLLVLCLLIAASAAVAPVKLIKNQCQVSFDEKSK